MHTKIPASIWEEGLVKQVLVAVTRNIPGDGLPVLLLPATIQPGFPVLSPE